MYFPDICDTNYTKNRPADINPETSCTMIDPDPGKNLFIRIFSKIFHL